MYTPALRRWWSFCIENSLDMFNPSGNHILEFLNKEFQKGLSYSALNCSRSAISLITGKACHNIRTIKRFLKGVANLRQAQPRYNHTWDPQCVLRYFGSHPTTSSTCLKDVLKKLVSLLALATGQRLQTLQKIDIENIQISPSKILIFVPGQVKTSGRGKLQPLLVLPFFKDPQLCPARTLAQYLTVTRNLRGSIKTLFITTTRPTKPATTQTLSRWVSEILNASGVEKIFRPHSTRHASTSAALRGGDSTDSMLCAAGWTPTSKMYAIFYNRPVITDNTNYALAVFNN